MVISNAVLNLLVMVLLRFMRPEIILRICKAALSLPVRLSVGELATTGIKSRSRNAY